MWHRSSSATGLPKSEHPHTKFKLSSPSNGDCGHLCCELYLLRLGRYCHPHLQADTANEGTLSPSAAERFQLVQVHIIARHGDRTPATSGYKIGTQPVDYECGLVDNDPKWLGLKDFPPRKSLSFTSSNAMLDLFPGTESKRCGVGSLTFEGFKMEYSLGALMQQQYTQFIGERIDVDKVFTHSTDYRRTIQSAGAFLLGFLPDDPLVRQKAVIHTSAFTMLQCPPTGIRPTYWYNCERYLSFLHKDRIRSGYFTEEKKRHYLVEKLCDMFEIHKRNEPIITDLFDHFLTRGCHTPVAADGTGFLPCNKQGECVDCTLAVKLFEFADWTWRHKHPLNSSIVAMLPFLKHSVVDIMENAINHQEPIKKFMLSFAHDTTIAQLLVSLGSTLLPNEWMPYASRIVFELWKNNAQSDTQYYVRVLFNGEPITNKILFSQPRSVVEKDHQLVLFSTWKEHLMTGNFRDINSYNEICTKFKIPFF